MTALGPLSDAANLLSEGDIDATNVLPAFLASLAHGVSAEELATEVGWRREALEKDGARVSGESTHRHMELMHGKPGYAQFVGAAVARHTASSLGIVGLACKTSATLGEAMACHGRFQHLTNRSARYTTEVDGDALTLLERRPGARLGSLLISDYTMLVALRLLRAVARDDLGHVVMHSRRVEIPDAERSHYAAWVGAPIQLGAPAAKLVLAVSLLDAPTAQADPEVAAYFRDVLERASPSRPDEAPIVRDARLAIRDGLARGRSSVGAVARALGLGARTLQRRLSAHDTRFAVLLEDARRGLAGGYLANPDLSIAEIAYLLGYAEQASFHRAFRRWYQTTPDAFRSRR